MKVKLATYNIQYGYGQDGHYDLNRVIKEVEGQDIICLQEVTTNWRASNRDDQPEIIASALNMYAAYAPAFEIDDSDADENGIIHNARRGFGNMVLSRWPISYSRPHSLPRPVTHVPAEFFPNVDFPRTALESLIDIGTTSLRVFSLHLSHLPGPQQLAQIAAIKKLGATLPEEPPLWENDPRIVQWSQKQKAPAVPMSTLFMGDFNFEPDSEYYSLMLEPLSEYSRPLVDVWNEGGGSSTHNYTCVENDERFSRLDYVFASDGMRGKN